MNIDQTYQQEDITVKFRENESAALYALKDREPYYLCVDILIHKEKTMIARYAYEFEKEVTALSYASFVKKFLENPDFRTPIVVEGKWEGMISYQTESGVNKKCVQYILRLNQKRNLKFKDFANLKTFGRDSFSKKKKEDLLSYVSEEELQSIKENFEEDKQIVTCLRWIGRGLILQHAIRKVKTDLEIQSNSIR